MKKVNEFKMNSTDLTEEFYRLNKELYYNTGVLSDPGVIKQSKYYKEILSYGDTMLPIIMNELITNPNASYTLCFLVFNLIEDKPERMEIPIEDSGVVNKIKGHQIKWWKENKDKYGG